MSFKETHGPIRPPADLTRPNAPRLARRGPKLRMRYCFACEVATGVRSDNDHDEFDTCGAMACRREARAELRELIAEERAWWCE